MGCEVGAALCSAVCGDEGTEEGTHQELEQSMSSRDSPYTHSPPVLQTLPQLCRCGYGSLGFYR